MSAIPINQADSQTKPLSLVEKLSQIMAEIDYVDKRGRNEFHKYNYVKAADLAHAVRGKLSEHHLIMLSDVVERNHYTIPGKDGEMQAEYLLIEYTIIDGESGEKLQFKVPGAGTDKGDKAVYKAITGSLKYALRNAFLVPDESDPEGDEEADKQTDFTGLHKKAIEHHSVGCPVCKGLGLSKPWKVVERNGHIFLKSLTGETPAHTFEANCQNYCPPCKIDYDKEQTKVPATPPRAAEKAPGDAPEPKGAEISSFPAPLNTGGAQNGSKSPKSADWPNVAPGAQVQVSGTQFMPAGGTDQPQPSRTTEGEIKAGSKVSASQSVPTGEAEKGRDGVAPPALPDKVQFLQDMVALVKLHSAGAFQEALGRAGYTSLDEVPQASFDRVLKAVSEDLGTPKTVLPNNTAVEPHGAEPKCPLCQGRMRFNAAGKAKKSGKPFSAFWGCMDFRRCKGAMQDSAWRKSIAAEDENQDSYEGHPVDTETVPF